MDVELFWYYFRGVENIEDSVLNDKIYKKVKVNNANFAFAILGA